MIPSDCLSISIDYNNTKFKKDTIQKLLTNYKSALETLVNFCLKQDKKELTPSDLTGNDLSLDEFEKINSLVENIL